MAKRRRRFNVSYSRLEHYHTCPAKYDYDQQAGEGKKTYPLLAGGVMHRLVKHMERPTKDGRRFYFKTKRSALNSWVRWWKIALQLAKEQNKLIIQDPVAELRYENIGRGCISHYWDANLHLPRPLLSEKRYEFPHPSRVGVRIVGELDQLREVSLAWIERMRPELVCGGRLDERYEPAVIVDHKSGKLGYDFYEGEKNAEGKSEYEALMSPEAYQAFKREQQARLQYELHKGLQPTFYTWLCEQVRRKRPVGFLWHHMRSGMYYFTYREPDHYEELFEIINDFLESAMAGSFHPRPSRFACGSCEHIFRCNKGKELLVSLGQPLASLGAGLAVMQEAFADPNAAAESAQLRLKITVPRSPRTT